MTNISEYIHEIVVALIFVFAVTLLMLLAGIATKTTNAVDTSSRQKNMIEEGASSVSELTVTGAEVYSDIWNYANTSADIDIIILNADGTTVYSPIPATLLDNMKSENISAELLNKDASGKRKIDPTAYYKKTFNTDSNGNISAVTYKKKG